MAKRATYEVQYGPTSQPDVTAEGGFTTKREAIAVAKDRAREHEGWTVRVIKATPQDLGGDIEQTVWSNQ